MYDKMEYRLATYHVTENFQPHPKTATSLVEKTKLVGDYCASVWMVQQKVVVVQ